MTLQKTYFKRLASILIALCMALSLLGCAITKPLVDSFNLVKSLSDNQASEEDNEDFDSYMKELFAELITSDAVSIHAYMENPKDFGIDEYELTLGRTDLDNLGDTEDLTDIITKLKSFDRTSLSEKQQITYDEVLAYMENALEYADLYLFNSELDITSGVHIELPMLMAEYTFEQKKDIDDYLEILADVDGYFENVLAFEKLRSDNGFFMEDTLADKVIESCKTFLASADSDEGVLISTFNERLSSFSNLTETEIANYKAKNAAVIKEHVIPGYQALIDGLTAMKGTNKYKGGLCNYPNGKEYYNCILQSCLGWDKTVDEFNDLVDSYMNKYVASMQRLMILHPTLASKYESFSFSLTDPIGILEDLKKRIVDDYPAIGEVSYDVKYISKALEDSASPAMYFIPQLDNLGVNSIYINGSDNNHNELYPTLAHEGYPGHLYQTQYFASTNPEWIRYIIAPGGYVEGWGSYVETKSYLYADTGSTALNELYSANYSTVLCIYAKCDLGVNYYGWTESDVYNYIKQYGYSDRDVAKDMYYAFVSNPGNYCKYVLGMLGFEELKSQAESSLGDSFVLKDFHQYVLDMGPVQFDILFKNLPAWIEKQKNKTV